MKNERNLNYAQPKNSRLKKMSLGRNNKSRHRDYTRHHRKCKANGGTDDDRNICLIPRKFHEAYHLLFANKTPEGVCDILNEYFIDPDYVLVPHRIVPDSTDPRQLEIDFEETLP